MYQNFNSKTALSSNHSLECDRDSLIDMYCEKEFKSYTLESKNRVAKVYSVLADIISKPYENNKVKHSACLVNIYEKQTNMFITSYVLPEFKVFSSYELMINHCKDLAKIAISPNSYYECGRYSLFSEDCKCKDLKKVKLYWL